MDSGRFLAVTRCHGKVLAIDLSPQDVQENVSLFAGPLASLFGGENVNLENHLVLIDGELFQVWASWVVPDEQQQGSDDDKEQ